MGSVKANKKNLSFSHISGVESHQVYSGTVMTAKVC